MSGYKQGCVIYLWLFNVYGWGGEGSEGVRERGATLRKNGNDREWKVNKLLFADDNVFVADSEESLSSSVREFGKV